MKFINKFALAIVIYCIAAPLFANDLLMVRTRQGFPEAMLTLQTSIKEHGYAISRVQRIDIGLTGMGYKTDKYRVVFVGKPDEFLTVDRYTDIIKYAGELREKNVIVIPHGSFVEYLGAEKFLTLPLPTFGNRKVLLWESDRIKEKQWLKSSDTEKCSLQRFRFSRSVISLPVL